MSLAVDQQLPLFCTVVHVIALCVDVCSATATSRYEEKSVPALCYAPGFETCVEKVWDGYLGHQMIVFEVADVVEEGIRLAWLRGLGELDNSWIRLRQLPYL